MIYRNEGKTVVSVAPQPKLISCCDEELVEVELEALRQGAEQAYKDDDHRLTTMQAMSEAATVACDRSLAVQYVPLDEHKFREVFTLAWCAGYRSESRRH